MVSNDTHKHSAKRDVIEGIDVASLDKMVGTENVLLPYQANYIRDARGEELVVVEKSRRIGLTWGEAADDVLYASTRRGGKNGGDDVNYIGPSLDMAREFITACGDWARSYNYACDEIEEFLFVDKGGKDEPDRHIKAFNITFASGNKIQALSSAPRSLRGRRGRVVIDEAAFHDDLAEILKAAIALTMWGASIRVISTHDGVSNPFNELIKEIRSGEREGKVFKITFQDAIDDGFYERVCLINGEEPSEEGKAAYIAKIRKLYGSAADEELDCIPSKSGGRYIPLTLIEPVAKDIPVLRWSQEDAFTLQPESIRTLACRVWCDDNLKPVLDILDVRREHCFGSDFARNGDQAVVWPLQITKFSKRETPFVVELDNIPFDQHYEILLYIVGRLPRFKLGAMDARGNGQWLAEKAKQKYGSRIIEVHATENWYLENMPPFKAAFQNRTISVPNDADIMSDIHMFEEVRGVGRMPDTRTNSKQAGAKGKTKRHGDAGIACAHAYFASRQDAVPIEFEGNGQTFVGDMNEMVEVDIGFGGVRRDLDMGGY